MHSGKPSGFPDHLPNAYEKPHCLENRDVLQLDPPLFPFFLTVDGGDLLFDAVGVRLQFVVGSSSPLVESSIGLPICKIPS